jgi:NADPH:quinone reductase-like Zn-dependent oxidoreductase
MGSSPKPVPKEMPALRVHAFGELPRLDSVPVPVPGPEDVVVELAASVVSRHDLTVAGGDFPLRPSLPYVPGIEGAGRVVRAGSEVHRDRISVGMPVRVFGGGLGATRPGTWAEYAAVTVRAATPVPPTLDLALAAACGSVAATALAAVIDLGALRPGERVGVTGASGAVGSLALQLAARNGAGSLVAWLRAPERARFLPSDVETLAPGDPVEPVDLLVDTLGGPLLPAHLRSVRPGGRAVLVGYTAGTETRLSLPDLLAADVSLLPLNMMRRRLAKGVEASLVGDVAAGRLRLAVETVAPGEIQEAIERLTRGGVSGRIVIAW